jgi:serine/threonine protein kinase/tetratricopeptide (TPR) repeat protein
VFAARWPGQGERVALKLLAPSAQGVRTALASEAAYLVRRVSGNVVQVLDVLALGDQTFFICELVEGRHLEVVLDRLRQRAQTLPPIFAVWLAMQVASGLASLRILQQRIPGAADAPLGLSTDSVLLGVDGEVKVLDYGPAMAGLVLPAPGRVLDIGRLALLAPEAVVSGRAGPPADVYAAGSLLWQMLTGNSIAGGHSAETLRSLLAGGGFRPHPPSSLQGAARIPEALERLVMEALSPDPLDRPASCEVLLERLAFVLRGLGPCDGERWAGFLRPLVAEELAAQRRDLERLEEKVLEESAQPGALRPATLRNVAARAEAAPTDSGVDLGAGAIIPGTRYRILSKIGEGGMGSVYAAEHVDLEKRVAVKLLRADLVRDEEALRLFRQEARAASRVGSIYIADVTDFGELADGRVFFVMEYLDGRTLGGLLRTEEALPQARTIALLRQVAKGLGAAHAKGIIHLDVKPDNVMLVTRGTRRDAVKVLDFGIAGLLVHGERAGDREKVAGTPEFVAPERVTGRGFDHRSDIYSLGVMAYVMLTGTVPFVGKDVLSTVTMHVKEPAIPPRRRAPQRNIHQAVEDVVMAMLHKDPAARPQSMSEVEARLCEAQIAASLRTEWDDLELPEVEEKRRQWLLENMPSASGRPRRVVFLTALGFALVGSVLAVYFGAIRKPRTIIQEVRVEVTRTEEAPSVAPWLLKADQAARAQRYTKPVGDSALYAIEQAEQAAAQEKRTSPGASALRRVYASALAVIGHELLKAELSELASVKLHEALLFQPQDQALRQEVAALEGESTVKHGKPLRAERSTPPAGATGEEGAPHEAVQEAATQVFLAVRAGKFSEARLSARTLRQADRKGMQTAQLADSLRKAAGARWESGRKAEAVPYYGVIAELDPGDAEASQRARYAAAEPAEAREEGAPTAGTPATAEASLGAIGKRTGHHDEEVADKVARDVPGSVRATEAGRSALEKGRLVEAESAFQQAIRMNPGNANAVVGRAAVAFERARYTEALDYARRAVRLAPRQAQGWIVLGDAYFKLLRYDDASDAYAKARTLDPRDASIESRLARVKARVGG